MVNPALDVNLPSWISASVTFKQSSILIRCPQVNEFLSALAAAADKNLFSRPKTQKNGPSILLRYSKISRVLCDCHCTECTRVRCRLIDVRRCLNRDGTFFRKPLRLGSARTTKFLLLLHRRSQGVHVHPQGEEKNEEGGKFTGKSCKCTPGRVRLHFLGNWRDLDGGSA